MQVLTACLTSSQEGVTNSGVSSLSLTCAALLMCHPRKGLWGTAGCLGSLDMGHHLISQQQSLLYAELKEISFVENKVGTSHSALEAASSSPSVWRGPKGPKLVTWAPQTASPKVLRDVIFHKICKVMFYSLCLHEHDRNSLNPSIICLYPYVVWSPKTVDFFKRKFPD